MAEKYRLVTRSDMDGLVCAVLLKELDIIDRIKFVHPKDVQDDKIDLTANDITTNLPYNPHVHLAFDHHASEVLRVDKKAKNHILDPEAPSAAYVVYNYYANQERFGNISKDILAAVDKADAAQFTREDILDPQGWELLSFLMDARTGLGRFKDFRISNYDLMMNLIDYCRDHTIEEILELADVKERVDVYMQHKALHREQLIQWGTVHNNLVVLDLRSAKTIYAGNRFVIYALYPDCNVSIHVLWGKDKQNIVFAVGKSIFKRDSQTNVGEIMLKYGGGGHSAAGTCQVAIEKAEEVLKELINQITTDG